MTVRKLAFLSSLSCVALFARASPAPQDPPDCTPQILVTHQGACADGLWKLQACAQTLAGGSGCALDWSAALVRSGFPTQVSSSQCSEELHSASAPLLHTFPCPDSGTSWLELELAGSGGCGGTQTHPDEIALALAIARVRILAAHILDERRSDGLVSRFPIELGIPADLLALARADGGPALSCFEARDDGTGTWEIVSIPVGEYPELDALLDELRELRAPH